MSIFSTVGSVKRRTVFPSWVSRCSMTYPTKCATSTKVCSKMTWRLGWCQEFSIIWKLIKVQSLAIRHLKEIKYSMLKFCKQCFFVFGILIVVWHGLSGKPVSDIYIGKSRSFSIPNNLPLYNYLFFNRGCIVWWIKNVIVYWKYCKVCNQALLG